MPRDLETQLQQDASAWRDALNARPSASPSPAVWQRYRLLTGGVALAAAVAMAGLIFLAWPTGTPPHPTAPTAFALPTWKNLIPPMPTTPVAKVPSINTWIAHANAKVQSPYRQEVHRLQHDTLRALRVVFSLTPKPVRRAVTLPAAS